LKRTKKEELGDQKTGRWATEKYDAGRNTVAKEVIKNKQGSALARGTKGREGE